MAQTFSSIFNTNRTRTRREARTGAPSSLIPCPTKPIHILSKPENTVSITKKDRDDILIETTKRESQLPLLTTVKSAISLYSWEDMQRMAPVVIKNLNLEGPGSVNDKRMGVYNLNEPCHYCSQIDCPGHFGLIDWSRNPIYNPCVIREIAAILTCVCNDCGKLLINEETIKSEGFSSLPFDKRLAAMEKYCKGDLPCMNKKTPLGGGVILPCAKNPTFVTTDIKKKGEITFKTGSGKSGKDENAQVHIMKIDTVIDILNKISIADAYLLGFHQPSKASLIRAYESIADSINKYGVTSNNFKAMSYIELLNILEKIPNSVRRELKIFDSDHPRNMIMRGMLVPPIIARTPVYEGGCEHHDQITNMLITIQRKVMDIANGKTTGTTDLYNTVMQLIFKTEGKRMGTKDFLSIIERIQGKHAILRECLMGKRVNWCGRTVAGPGPNLRFGQFGTPEYWMTTLTKPVKVTDFNIKYLTQLQKEGKITHITPKSTNLRKFYNPKSTYRLKIGDKVERWLQDDDRIVVNRQPTLHRHSMMGFRVVLHPYLVLKSHLSYTTPMNCDYDGDENNLWNPQDVESEAEVEIIMNVENNVMSAEQNKPVMGLVMNSISGAYLLTKPSQIKIDDKNIDKIMRKRLERAFNIEYLNVLLLNKSYDQLKDIINKIEKVDNKLNQNQLIELARNLIKNNERLEKIYDELNINKLIESEEIIDEGLYQELMLFIGDKERLKSLDARCIKYGVNPRSGAAVFSALLPVDFYYNMKGVVIIQGVLTMGQLKKAHVGASHRSIIQELWKNYDPKTTSTFFTEAPWILNKWLIERGFSVGLLDCVNLAIDETTGEEYDKNQLIMKKELANTYIQIEALGGKKDDDFEEEYRQRKIDSAVNIAQGVGLRLAKEVLSGDNSIGVMTEYGAGTKGGVANIGQMFGSVGQQYYHGKRLEPSITNNTRLLPCFDSNDNNPEANAFIPESFFTGISPPGLFFLQAGGREGLLDTALKTAETGSMNHKMIKAFENIVYAYDGSIRNTVGVMFSPMYNSGYDIAEMVAVEHPNKTDFSSFCDLKAIVNEINMKRGWVPQSVNENIIKKRIQNKLPINNLPPEITNTDHTVDLTKRIVDESSLSKINKFEKARLIGTRAKQLENNAPPLIDIGDEHNALNIAIMEYESGALGAMENPLYIIRKAPDGTYTTIVPTIDNI